MNEYDYKITFLNDQGYVSGTEYCTSTGETEDDARDKAHSYAEDELDTVSSYDDYEIELIDAH